MSGHNCISLPPMQSGPGAFFGFRCLISNPTSSLHIGSMKNEFITLAGKYSVYLPPQSGNSDFKTSPIVQKWLFMASDILCLSFMNFPSINSLLIEVDFDPALGFIMGFRVFHILYTEFLFLVSCATAVMLIQVCVSVTVYCPGRKVGLGSSHIIRTLHRWFIESSITWRNLCLSESVCSL